jgi:hypothetical protein
LAYKSCTIAAAAGFLANKRLSFETVVYKNHDLRPVKPAKPWIWMGWIPGNYGHTDFFLFPYSDRIGAGEEKQKTILSV